MPRLLTEEQKRRASERFRAWRIANAEHKNAYDKEWRKNNREKRRAIVRRYRTKAGEKYLSQARAYKRQWHSENIALSRQRKKSWRDRNRDAVSMQKRWSTYRLTQEAYLAMVASTNGCCFICGQPPNGKRQHRTLYVDHDHKTGVVRGLLCGLCNTAVGMLQDCEHLCRRAADYLAASRAKQAIASALESKRDNSNEERNNPDGSNTRPVTHHRRRGAQQGGRALRGTDVRRGGHRGGA